MAPHDQVRARGAARAATSSKTDSAVALLWAVIVAATCDSRAAERASCIEQAVQRAELPAGTDAAEVIRAVSAPLYSRLLISGDPVEPRGLPRFPDDPDDERFLRTRPSEDGGLELFDESMPNWRRNSATSARNAVITASCASIRAA